MKRKAEHLKEEVHDAAAAPAAPTAAAPTTADHAEVEELDATIEQAIIKTLRARGLTKSACPSEIPRLVLKLPNWREHMALTRTVARRLATQGLVEVLSKMQPIDPTAEVKGPIRLRATQLLLDGK